MDADILKAVLGAGSMSSLVLLGVWQLLKHAVNAFRQAMDTMNELHQDRANMLERKLETCEKRHEDANIQIARLREDCGILKGRVQALEVLSSYR